LTEHDALVNKVDDNDDENNARLSEINKRLQEIDAHLAESNAA